MKNKTLLILLNAGLLLIMVSNVLARPMAGMILLDGLALAGLSGVLFLRRHKQAGQRKDDKH